MITAVKTITTSLCEGLHVTLLAKVAYHHSQTPSFRYRPRPQDPLALKVTHSHLATRGSQQPQPCRQASRAKQPMSASRQEGENIKLAVRACPLLPGHSLMGMTVRGRGTAGSGGHGPVALRIPPGGDSASFHRAARPDWASFPGLSPASGVFLAFLSLREPVTRRMPPPFPSESLLLRPVRPLLAARSLVDLCVGSPLRGEPSGSGHQWSLTSLGKPLKASGPQSPHP